MRGRVFVSFTSEFRAPNRVKDHGFGVKNYANRLDRHGTQRRQRWKSNQHMQEKKLGGKKLSQMHAERLTQTGSGTAELECGGCGHVGDSLMERNVLGLWR